MTQSELAPLIEKLERRVEEAERKANSLREALNVLREDAGMPPRPSGIGSPDGAPAAQAAEIGSDTFFGKKQQTAVREYLEMRKSHGDEGPATPREIYDALVAGGFKYEAKKAETALVGLRAMLRKRTNVFVRVGDTGKYGLLSWYPDYRRQKDEPDDDDDSDDEMSAESNKNKPLEDSNDESESEIETATDDESAAA